MIRYKKLGYVALNVTDLARSSVFYRDTLGLQPVESDQTGGKLIGVAKSSTSQNLSHG